MLVLPGCVPATQRPVAERQAVKTTQPLHATSAPRADANQPAAISAAASGALSGTPAAAPASAPVSLPPRQPHSLQTTLFNATAAFLGLPGLAPAYGMDGLRASSYASAGMGRDRDWLYGNMFGDTVDKQGRMWGMGSQYSRLRYSGGMGRELFSHSGAGGGLFDSALRKGLSAGMGFANSAVESSILGLMGKDSPYGNGKARLNFYLDLDQKGEARLQGEGDILWPLYDNPYTTIYTQVGARSMYGGGENYGPDRWIGNIGLGQRWFPAATVDEDGTLDSGNWMVGYNAFFDYDITRGHQRGGLGAEAQYDWLKLAANYYLPLSDWQDSKDFDGHYVQERAAEGWDLRVKGYLPFYREVALTGAYTQWYGDHVGMFGPSKREKDPKVWSYGVEYTPVPAVTAFVNQRQTERGRTDTEFGLRFTYNFGMDAEEQFKPSRVAQMRTVHGARHDFVDRENKIILEYRAKNRFRVDFLGFDGANTFSFRLRNGFDQNAAGQAVRVTAGGAVKVAEAHAQSKTLFAQALEVLDGLVSVRTAHADSGMSYTTDSEGIVRVRVDNPGKLDSLSVSAGETTTGFTRDSMGLGPKVVADIQSEKAEVDASGKATITIKGAAYNADVQWKVESIAPSTGSGTIEGGGKTSDKGEATATFTGTAAGAVNIIATVGGERMVCQMTVKDNAYEITASPTALTQLTSTAVTFTVTKKGMAVASTSVSVTANAALGVSASTPSTNGSGQFTLTLKPTAAAAGTQQLAFTIDNKSITKDFTVSTLNLTLAPTDAEIFAGTSTIVTLANAPVGLSVDWNVVGNGELSGQQTTVQAGGKATATLKAKDTATGTIKVTAKVGGASGISTDCTVTVNANKYGITADTPELTQLTSQEVTFTVTKNSTATDDLSVSVAANAALGINTKQDKTTQGGGKFTLTLKPTAVATSPQKLECTIDGKPVSVNFTVNAHSLQLVASPTSIFVSGTSTLTLSNAPVGEAVTWAIASGSGGLSNQQTTVQLDGTATATLAGTAAGPVVVKATVNGVDKTATVTVAATTYTLEANPTALTQLTPTSVTFTVKRNGTALRNTSVTFTSNANFTNLPSTQSTNDNGQIIVSNLTATASGAQTVEITVEGKTATVTFTVTPATFSYDLFNLTVDGSGNLGGTIKVTVSDSNNPAANVYVTVPLKYRTAGGQSGTPAASGLSISNTTDDSGNLAAIGNVTALARKIDFSVDNFATTSTQLTVGTVPSGFLTGQSLNYMDWNNAKSYCAEHGGKIPRINGADSWDGSGLSSIDGFGIGGWPSALPPDYYWTGSENSIVMSYAWVVNAYGGRVNVDLVNKSTGNRAACVP